MNDESWYITFPVVITMAIGLLLLLWWFWKHFNKITPEEEEIDLLIWKMQQRRKRQERHGEYTMRGPRLRDYGQEEDKRERFDLFDFSPEKIAERKERAERAERERAAKRTEQAGGSGPAATFHYGISKGKGKTPDKASLKGKSSLNKD